jgi:hypothetical protein
MIRAGLVNIDVSHPKAFSDHFLKSDRIRYAAVYNDGFRGDDEVAAFMKKAGIPERCRTVDDLAEVSDIGFIQGCNWDRHLERAEPFIRKGKPVFVDKPLAGKPADLRKWEELVRDGAVVLGSSSVRYAPEIRDVKQSITEKNGKVAHIYAASGVDSFSYAVHAVEGISALMESSPVSVMYLGATEEIDGNICSGYRITFTNGAAAEYTVMEPRWLPFDFVVLSSGGSFPFRVTSGYGSMLDLICDYMETGVNKMASIRTLADSVRVLLSAKISKENGGKVINIRDIPDDYSGFDGTGFEKAYAAQTNKIYLK